MKSIRKYYGVPAKRGRRAATPRMIAESREAEMESLFHYLCDTCKAPTFCDAGIYMQPDINTNPDTGKIWPAGNVGWMVVLCKRCAANFRVEIVERESDDLP